MCKYTQRYIYVSMHAQRLFKFVLIGRLKFLVNQNLESKIRFRIRW